MTDYIGQQHAQRVIGLVQKWQVPSVALVGVKVDQSRRGQEYINHLRTVANSTGIYHQIFQITPQNPTNRLIALPEAYILKDPKTAEQFQGLVRKFGPVRNAIREHGKARRAEYERLTKKITSPIGLLCAPEPIEVNFGPHEFNMQQLSDWKTVYQIFLDFNGFL